VDFEAQTFSRFFIRWNLSKIRFPECSPGLPDFSRYKIPKWGKIYQMAIYYSQYQKNRPKGHKIYQDFPLQDPPKVTQNRDFWFENKTIWQT
jgi:hypothetical protein